MNRREIDAVEHDDVTLVDDYSGQRMASEIFNELPADHPDILCIDNIKAVRRAGTID